MQDSRMNNNNNRVGNRLLLSKLHKMMMMKFLKHSMENKINPSQNNNQNQNITAYKIQKPGLAKPLQNQQRNLKKKLKKKKKNHKPKKMTSNLKLLHGQVPMKEACLSRLKKPKKETHLIQMMCSLKILQIQHGLEKFLLKKKWRRVMMEERYNKLGQEKKKLRKMKKIKQFIGQMNLKEKCQLLRKPQKLRKMEK